MTPVGTDCRFHTTRVEMRSLAFVAALFLACWAAVGRFWGQWLAPDYPSTGLWTMLAALLAWGVLFHKSRDALQQPTKILLLLCAALLAIYATTYQPFSRLVSSAIAVSAVSIGLLATLSAARRRSSLGLLPWMLASLPLGIAFNVYFGFPLRLLVGSLASWVLGAGIEPLGAGLTDGTHTVFIDAPCSGVRMLRLTALLVGIIAVLTQLRAGSTLVLGAIGLGLALLGNTARVALLFLLYRRGEVPDWIHEWTGVTAFAGCVAFLVMTALHLQRRQGLKGERPSLPSRPYRFSWVVNGALGVTLAMAALVPLRAEEHVHAASGVAVWPELVDGEHWTAIPSDAAMMKYRESYIGAWVRGELNESGRNILMRQCDAPTLTLHTTEECYRAFGFTCTTLDAWLDSQGHLWSRFRAEHPDGRIYRVRQCFFSIDPQSIADGGALEVWTQSAKSWPDAASWYWAAARPGSGVGRTLAVAIAEVSEDRD